MLVRPHAGPAACFSDEKSKSYSLEIRGKRWLYQCVTIQSKDMMSDILWIKEVVRDSSRTSSRG